MSYAIFSLIKQQAKVLSKSEGISLSSAQELFAQRAKFYNFHDLTTVATRDPDDPRLGRAAFGVNDLKDAIREDDLPSQLDNLLEDATSEAWADMNASDFRVTSLKITSANYDSGSRKAGPGSTSFVVSTVGLSMKRLRLRSLTASPTATLIGSTSWSTSMISIWSRKPLRLNGT